MTQAMGRAPDPVQVACQATGAKVTVTPTLCALFLQRLAAAYPDRSFTQGEPADLILVVSRNDARGFAARIDLGDTQGAPLATVRRGAPLDDAARALLMDALIAATPL